MRRGHWTPRGRARPRCRRPQSLQSPRTPRAPPISHLGRFQLALGRLDRLPRLLGGPLLAGGGFVDGRHGGEGAGVRAPAGGRRGVWPTAPHWLPLTPMTVQPSAAPAAVDRHAPWRDRVACKAAAAHAPHHAPGVNAGGAGPSGGAPLSRKPDAGPGGRRRPPSALRGGGRSSRGSRPPPTPRSPPPTSTRRPPPPTPAPPPTTPPARSSAGVRPPRRPSTTPSTRQSWPPRRLRAC